MKKLLLLLLLPACTKEDTQSYRVLPKSSLSIELQSFWGEGSTAYADGVRFDFSPSYSKGFEKADVIDNPKQANDLGINDANQVLSVDALPVKNDSVPLMIQRPNGTMYNLKLTATNTTGRIFLVDNYYKGASDAVTSKKVTEIKGTTNYYFETNNYYKTVRFWVVVKK